MELKRAIEDKKTKNKEFFNFQKNVFLGKIHFLRTVVIIHKKVKRKKMVKKYLYRRN